MTKTTNELSWVGCLAAAASISIGLALAAVEAWIVMVVMHFLHSIWSVIPAWDFLPIFVTWVGLNILALVWLTIRGSREVKTYEQAVNL